MTTGEPSCGGHRQPPLHVFVGRAAPHIVVVTVAGEIDVATAPRLTEAVQAAIRNASEHVILDLQPVTFFSSAGVNALITIHERTNRRGIDLHLAGAEGNHVVARVLDLTGLTKRFRVHPAVTDALAEIGTTR
jgi:anti-anti-sigma factor